MTPEQEGLDLIMDIIQRMKQKKKYKKPLRKLQQLAKKSLQVRKMYDNLLESVKQ
jgi:hypothetical protein